MRSTRRASSSQKVPDTYLPIIASQPAGDAIWATQRGARIYNNILWVDAGDAFVISGNAVSGFRSDYNLIYLGLDPSSQVGSWDGRPRHTLPDWRASSGQDLHSLIADPMFVEPQGSDQVSGYDAELDIDGGSDDTFQLRPHSPAIDRGHSWFGSIHDRDGNQRRPTPGISAVGSPDYRVFASDVRDTTVVFDVMANDISQAELDREKLRVLAVSSEDVLISQDEAGWLVIEPVEGFTGTVKFQYQITDSDGLISQPMTSLIHVRHSGGQNPRDLADVLNSGAVTPLDALSILNAISRYRAVGSSGVEVKTLRQSGVIDDQHGPFYDVNGDLEVTPLDALLVLIAIVRQRAEGSGISAEGEMGESPVTDAFWHSPGVPGIDWLEQLKRQPADRADGELLLF